MKFLEKLWLCGKYEQMMNVHPMKINNNILRINPLIIKIVNSKRHNWLPPSQISLLPNITVIKDPKKSLLIEGKKIIFNRRMNV